MALVAGCRMFHAAEFAKSNGAGRAGDDQLADLAQKALAPFDTPQGSAEAPFQLQHELQESMQKLVGIVRTQEEMDRAVDRIQEIRTRAAHISVTGNREFNPGWHTALDLQNLLTMAEAIARAAAQRRESRGAHFRADYETKDEQWGKTWNVVRKASDGSMSVIQEPILPMPEELRMLLREKP